jgi:hypothetical protein
MGEFAIDGHWSSLPEHQRHPLDNYIARGVLTPFVAALAANDLAGAVEHADEESRGRLGDFVDFLLAYAPPAAWGSLDTVAQWSLAGGLEGLRRKREPLSVDEIESVAYARHPLAPKPLFQQVA